MRIGGGKHQRSSLGGQHQFRPLRAVHLFGIDGVERRHLRRLDRRQRGHQDRLGIVKRGRRVEFERKLIALLGGQRGNVLVLRGVKGIHDARDVHDRGDIGAVIAIARLRRGAQLQGQIGDGTRSERLNNRGSVPIAQHQPVLSLHQAGGLQIGHFLETGRIEFDGQAARQQQRTLFQLVRIVPIDLADGRQVGIQPGAVEDRLIEILRGAHESSGASANGSDQRFEVSAGLWSQENEKLLGILGNCDLQPATTLSIPGLGGIKPAFRGRIGCAAQKHRNEEVMHRLSGREVRPDRQLVARGEIRHLGNRQGLARVGHFDFEAGAGQIEGGWIGQGQTRGNEKKKDQAKKALKRSHTLILEQNQSPCVLFNSCEVAAP